jgi:glycosyltransferase involved in cell wall biosynthesis
MKSLTKDLVTIEDKNLVSCIMPTYNRRAFLPHAIRYFLRQDYPHKELIIIDDGTDNISDLVPAADNIRYYRLDNKITLGAKLNLACTYAKGNIIANWDDDDWYADRRLSYQVTALQRSGTAVCGINRLLYYDFKNRKGYQYIYPADQRVWLLGSSLCFTKELWENNIFADINVGMDGLFVWATPPQQVKVLEDHTFSVHMIHAENVSPKKTSGSYWHGYPVEDLQQIMDEDWHCYINDGFYDDEKDVAIQNKVKPVVASAKFKLLKNIYACLVHENEDCIIDLVRNLHYQDPASVILLYNGGKDPDLLTEKFPYKKYGAVIYPDPVPQQHGYLHRFALDSMQYALDHFSFDILTIVDSDQLCIRKGYPEYLSRYFANTSNVGMLSSMPEKVSRGNTKNLVAAQAYKEYALWKPLLDSFSDGDDKFVHWTFWPSTVFTRAAIGDLLKLFKENEQLQSIMQQTKIWATEEIIFPTLLKLLGYEITQNPCRYDYVKYRKKYTLQEIKDAIDDTEIFWAHPVERNYKDSLRIFTRLHFNSYESAKHPLPVIKEDMVVAPKNLIEMIQNIEGWLTDDEAMVLIDAAKKACFVTDGLTNIVEIGSYHGKSTVLLGTILQACSTGGKLYAIDTHDGQLGAADLGLRSYPPSLAMFKKNIARASLENVVEIIKEKSSNVDLQVPVSLLFIDGLHDYENVSTDFHQFSKQLLPGSYAAFHDYANYYPGVKKIVDELMATNQYHLILQVQSMILLQKDPAAAHKG